jgi:hypothetical protein
MYEMGGPCPASPRQPGQLPGLAGTARRPPVPGARTKGRSPGSSHVPGVAPKVVPVSNGESISTASANTAQVPELILFRAFPLSTRYPQKEYGYPHLMVVIHRLIHNQSTSHPV